MAKTIKVDEVRKSRRGRRPNLDSDLCDILAAVKSGQAVVLDDEFGEVDKDDRPTVSATIRKHWKAARDDKDKPSVNFSPEGVPQVSIRN